MNRRGLVLGFSLLAMAVSLVVIVQRLRNPVAGKVITDYAEFIGERLGEAAVQAVPVPSNLVVIVAGGVNASDPFTDGYLRGLKDVVRRANPSATVTVDRVVADFMAMQSGAPVFSAAEFRRVVEAHPGGDLFVSLTGIPEYRPGALPEGRAPVLVALAVYGGAVDPWFRERVLRAAVVPASGGEVEAGPSGPGLKARFEREYRVLKPET